MNYAEFWVLETAVELGIPLACLVGPPAAVQRQWNKPYHGCSRASMADLLASLLAERDIVISVDEREVLNPTRDAIDDWLTWRRPTSTDPYYRLTPQGGERWADFAKADWTRYHTFEWDCDFDDYLEIGALTSEIADRAFRYVPEWNDLRVFPETVTHRTQSPWNATYWKVFPLGHIIRFRTEYLDSHETCTVSMSLGNSTQISKLSEEYEHFANWYARHPETPMTGTSLDACQ